MHLRDLAAMLDTHAAGQAGEEDTSQQAVLPTPPPTTSSLRWPRHGTAPGQGAWHDRWARPCGTTRIVPGGSRLLLASAGADKTWKTKDDLWVGRYGDKSWSWQAEKKKEKSDQ